MYLKCNTVVHENENLVQNRHSLCLLRAGWEESELNYRPDCGSILNASIYKW